ncbi:MAG TPA: hypothetical protein OIM00_07865 [Oscillospiraceae bacterium]|nr:hypothetical protein [Oscillospiraceae bacterium]
MEKEKLSDIISKKVLYIIFAVLGVFMCGVQIVLIVAEHKVYSNGVWYMLAVLWLLFAGFFVYKYVKTVKNEKAEAQKIAEFKEKYKIK